MEFREKAKTTQVLDRFRLRMTGYLHGNSGIVNKWLSFACERSVKEVELSLEIAWNKQLQFYYCLSPISLLNANSVTSLNLEFVRIQDIRCAEIVHTDHLLASLFEKHVPEKCVLGLPGSFNLNQGVSFHRVFVTN